MVLPCRPGKPEAGLKPSSHQQSPLLALARWARKGPAGPALPSPWVPLPRRCSPAAPLKVPSPSWLHRSLTIFPVPSVQGALVVSTLGPRYTDGQCPRSRVSEWSAPSVQGIWMVSPLCPGYPNGQRSLSRVSDWSVPSIQGIRMFSALGPRHPVQLHRVAIQPVPSRSLVSPSVHPQAQCCCLAAPLPWERSTQSLVSLGTSKHTFSPHFLSHHFTY